ESQGLLEARNAQGEHELGAQGERPLGPDERPPAGDVPRVVREEGVEPLVAHLQLDRLALLPAALVLSVAHTLASRGGPTCGLLERDYSRGLTGQGDETGPRQRPARPRAPPRLQRAAQPGSPPTRTSPNSRKQRPG